MEDDILEGLKNTISNNRPIIVIEICGGRDFFNTSEIIQSKILNTMKKIENLDYHLQKVWVHDYLAIPKEKL